MSRASSSGSPWSPLTLGVHPVLGSHPESRATPSVPTRGRSAAGKGCGGGTPLSLRNGAGGTDAPQVPSPKWCLLWGGMEEEMAGAQEVSGGTPTPPGEMRPPWA